MRLVAIRC